MLCYVHQLVTNYLSAVWCWAGSVSLVYTSFSSENNYFVNSPYRCVVLPNPDRISPQRQTCQFLECQWSAPSSLAGHHPSAVGTDRSRRRRCRHRGPGEVTEGGVGARGRGQLPHNHMWKSEARCRCCPEVPDSRLEGPPHGWFRIFWSNTASDENWSTLEAAEDKKERKRNLQSMVVSCRCAHTHHKEHATINKSAEYHSHQDCNIHLVYLAHD